jgi:hypothetical protein
VAVGNVTGIGVGARDCGGFGLGGWIGIQADSKRGINKAKIQRCFVFTVPSFRNIN